ncbi:Glu-tRNA(Gln) amidotransferase GatDE subunit D [Candidatus Pacearchaeota archaeon ex4484_71]|nr:MAG: Glu-tRNA(Gln) amidotransferase GatDE subunit D [Candidatus Pacearchaeota archaeon ex4484_71]
MSNFSANPGDLVEVHLSKVIYEGILLESSKSESKIVLLKLGTGYNIGLNKKDILKIKVIKKRKKEEKQAEFHKQSEKPNVAMVITGGTIASKYDPLTGGVKWLTDPENLFRFYPELFDRVNVSKVEVPFMKGSENMDFKDWKKIANIVEKFLNDSSIKGVIVTQGTDTLHYTSSALSFFLGRVNKPVVLTYSQRSIDRASSDAHLNLECSAIAAISDIAEVMVVGHADTNDEFCYAIRGTKVRKMHSSKRGAFKAINSMPLAKISGENVEILSSYNLRNKTKVKLDSRFEEKVGLLKFYPGQDSGILDYYLDKGYKGIVLEVFGLGHVATKEARKSWTRKIKEVIKKGLVVCAAPQTIYGRLDPFVYSTGRELLDTGIIYLEDMLAETAFVKLGWVLGHKEWAKNIETVKEKMLENISGEIGERIEE